MIHPETDWVAKWAHYTPRHLCLRDHATGAEWDYEAADLRARSVASWLRTEHGIGRGDRIAVLAHNTCEYVFLFLACVKLGAVLVPLNFRLTEAELAVPLTDAEPTLVVCTEELARRITGAGAPCTAMATVSSARSGDVTEPMNGLSLYFIWL